MTGKPFVASDVLTAWVHERVTTGTLISLPDTYYLPSAGQLWLEVDRVGSISRCGDIAYVTVVGWDVARRARGQQVSREVQVRLDALHVPGVLVHPFPPLDDGHDPDR
ncbi:hypothetical protein ACWDV4_00445 [Micromonospora sp. NPDC003197]